MPRETPLRVHRSAGLLLLLFAAIVLVLPGCATTSSRRHRGQIRTVVDHGVSQLGQSKVRVGSKPFRAKARFFDGVERNMVACRTVVSDVAY